MKRYTLYILTALLTIVGIQSVKAQAVQDALYIFRNDGGFNAFFFADIDRFEYSNIDTLGIAHDDMVVQEIYALDTLYRIPISAIDSIAFVTPETVYKKDVAHTSESDLWNYVISSDSMSTLVLAANTPSSMIPKTGDKLVTINPSKALPAGFVGKVNSVANHAGGITVKCDLIELPDVFDQYVAKSNTLVVDEASARGLLTRAPSETPENSNVEWPFDHTFDFLSLGGVAQFGQILVSGKVAKLRVHGKLNLWSRFFYMVDLSGSYKEFALRVETDAYITPTVNASVTLRVDIPLTPVPPLPIPGIPLTFVTPTGGVTLSYTGSVNTSYTYHTNAVCIQNSQSNMSLANLDGLKFKNSNTDFHLQSFKHDLTTDKISGSYSGTLGFYGAGTVSVGPLPLGVKVLTIRQELGIKPTVSADFKEGDFTTLLPQVLGFKEGDTHYATYQLLSREACISAQPYVSIKALVGAGVGPLGGYGTVETSWDLTKLKAWFPDVFKSNWWSIEGQLAPNFSETSLNFENDSPAPTAKVGVSGRAVFSVPVGFAAYYKDSGKQLGKTVWNKQEYKTWYNWKDDYANNDNIKEYSLQLPKFGGGKEVRVYPTFKLFDYELLGAPYKAYTVPAKITSDPNKLPFDAEGGKQTFTVSDNLDREEDTYKSDYHIAYDKKGDDWLTVSLDKGIYTVVAQPNTTDGPRTANVEVEVYNEGKNPHLTLKVPVTQKAPEYEFSVSPDTLEIPGYSTSFTNGKLTRQLTVVYPKTAKSVSVTSSDKTWLTVDDGWTDTKTGDINTTAKRNVYITANTSLDKPRGGTLTVTLTKADNTTETKTVKVSQKALELKIELEPGEVILTAEEKAGAKYSEKKTVMIKRSPYDAIIAAQVKSEEAEPNIGWIKSAVKGNIIEVYGEANPVEEDRSNSITYTLTMKDGSKLTLPIKVTQLKKVVNPPFTIKPNPIRFGVKGGEIKAEVIGDEVDHVKTIDFRGRSWCGGSGMNKSIVISVDPNPNPEERIGDFYLTVVMKDKREESLYFLFYQDGTETAPIEVPEGFPSQEVLNNLEKAGMPVYYGNTPPSVDGVYAFAPATLVARHMTYKEGAEVEESDSDLPNVVNRFSSQTPVGTISWNAYDVYVEDGEVEPDGAYPYDIQGYIMGEGNNFFIAAPLDKALNTFYQYFFQLPEGQYGYVISGEIDGDVIRNMYYSFTSWTQANNYGIMKDSDGVSNKTTWAPYVYEDDDDDDDDWYARPKTRSISNASGSPTIAKKLKALGMILKRHK